MPPRSSPVRPARTDHFGRRKFSLAHHKISFRFQHEIDAVAFALFEPFAQDSRASECLRRVSSCRTLLFPFIPLSLRIFIKRLHALNENRCSGLDYAPGPASTQPNEHFYDSAGHTSERVQSEWKNFEQYGSL